MTSFKYLIFLCGILLFTSTCTTFASGSGAKGISTQDAFQTLSIWERIALHTVSKLSPSSFENVPLEGLFSAEEDNPYFVDSIFTDLRSILVQLWNVQSDQDIGRVNWHYEFEFCYLGCAYIRLDAASKESRLMYLKDMVHETEITPTQVRNRYYIPRFLWSSPDLLFNYSVGYDQLEITDLFYGHYITLEEVNTTFVFDYAYVPELGIQVDKLDIEFSVGSMELLIKNVTYIDFVQGTTTEYGPAFGDYAESVVSDWMNLYKDDYMLRLKASINCLLSGGRVDPIGCEEQPNYDYNKFNVVQLFQTFGLAAVNRPETGPL